MIISPHGNSTRGDQLAARSGMRKSLGSYGSPPRDILIGREYEKFFNIELLRVNDPALLARYYVQAYLATAIRNNPQVTYFEGPNEQAIGSADDMRRYADFEAERAYQVSLLGSKAAVGCFATGNPQYNFIKYFQPALDAAKETGGILAIHEYGNTLPPAVQVQGHFLLGFFKMWLEQDPNILIAITETGTDNVPPDGKPWRVLDWSDDYYAAWLWQLELEYRKNPRILGAFLFCFGGGSDWSDFEVDNSSVVDKLLAFDDGNPESVITNQTVINAFSKVYGGLAFWPKLVSLGWADLALKRKQRFNRYLSELPVSGKERRALSKIVYG